MHGTWHHSKVYFIAFIRHLVVDITFMAANRNQPHIISRKKCKHICTFCLEKLTVLINQPFLEVSFGFNFGINHTLWCKAGTVPFILRRGEPFHRGQVILKLNLQFEFRYYFKQNAAPFLDRFSHVKFAFMLSPLAVLEEASPFLADETVFLQGWIRAFGIETGCFRYERSNWEIIV